MRAYSSNTKPGAEGVDQMVESAIAGVQNTAKSAAQQLENAADAFSKQTTEAADNVREVANNLGEAIDKSLKTRPLTSLTMTAVAGFFIGALWKS